MLGFQVFGLFEVHGTKVLKIVGFQPSGYTTAALDLTNTMQGLPLKPNPNVNQIHVHAKLGWCAVGRPNRCMYRAMERVAHAPTFFFEGAP